MNNNLTIGTPQVSSDEPTKEYNRFLQISDPLIEVQHVNYLLSNPSSIPKIQKYRQTRVKRSIFKQTLALLLFAFLTWALPATDAQESKPDSQARPDTKLEFSKWSGDLNVPDPVSISFDENGRAYATQTQRRKSQDLDIRQNTAWIPNDLSFQTVTDKRNFYRTNLSPDKNNLPGESNSKHVEDHNKDGSHDYRDLMVLSEKIHLLEYDIDSRNQTAKRVQVYAEGFDTEVTGIAAGVLAHNGDVYATVAPDVWRLRDTTGDGKADKREIIATGFGIHIAYAGHDMHGLTVGPDGRIYWSIGDKGISASSKSGKRFHYPNQGGVMRCDPDGSNFEIFAHGLRNVQELAFDQYGNLFGVDNDSDQPKERERFVYITKGMDAGWRCNYQYRGSDYNPWMKERMWEPYTSETAPDQPRYIIPPISNTVNGPCGFAFNPGTALSKDYRDYFFLTSTLGGEQISFKVDPDGDSFKMVNEHQIGKGIAMIGINFGPDGGLYGVDWAGGYPLNQKGHVWKIDAPESGLDKAHNSLRTETAKLLRLDYSQLQSQQLMGLLDHPDQRVRLKSQFELVKRKDIKTLTATAESPFSIIPHLHALWGLGQLARNNDTTARETIAQIVATVCERHIAQNNRDIERYLIAALRTYGDCPNPKPLPEVVWKSPSPHVLQQAAQVNTNLESQARFQHLVGLAKKLKPDQHYLRHAITMGMANSEYRSIQSRQSIKGPVKTERLRQLANHQSESVRLCGIIAIRKLASLLNNDKLQLEIDLSEFLVDQSEGIATEAARAIHDDFSIESAIPQLAVQLGSTKVDREAFLVRALNANYRIGDPECLRRVIEFAAANIENGLGSQALSSLKNWETPVLLDRVTGRHRGKHSARPIDRAVIKPLLIAILNNSIAKPFEGDRQPAVEVIDAMSALKIEIPKSQLLKIFHSKLPGPTRAEALTGLVKQSPNPADDKEVSKAVKWSLNSKSKVVRKRGLTIASESYPDLAVENIMAILSNRSDSPIDEKQLAFSLLNKLESTNGASLVLLLQLSALLESQADSRLHLDIIEAAEASSDKSIADLKQKLIGARERLAKSYLKLDDDKMMMNRDLIGFFECAEGGDPTKGKTIFNTNIDAQCARCHRIGKQGSNVGPDLSKVASREPAISDHNYLLRSIVAPSAEIDEKYLFKMFLLDSGQMIKGIVTKETKKTTTLLNEAGKQIVIENDEIEDEIKQKISIMPQAKTLTKREIRDLVAYLKTLKKKKNK